MTLADALATFRARLERHTKWMAQNAGKIDELVFVLDELKKVEATMREDDAVRKVALQEVCRAAMNIPFEWFTCHSCGKQETRALNAFDHLLACEPFRASVLGQSLTETP